MVLTGVLWGNMLTIVGARFNYAPTDASATMNARIAA